MRPGTTGKKGLNPALAGAAGLDGVTLGRRRKAIMNRSLYTGAAFIGVIGGLGIGSVVLDRQARAATVMAPRFEVDPLWPKPLPNHW
ncbi:MAG: hypothetical protein ACRD5L_08200, partial [Bryobacteraceae bacterium]